MHTEKKYPTCLEGTDRAGIVRARTKKVEEGYRKRLDGWRRRLASKMGEPHVEIEDVIHDLVCRAAELKKTSFYVYQATILQGLRDDYDNGNLSEGQAVALTKRLSAVDKPQIGSRVKSKRTSSGRRRHIRPEVLSSLVTEASVRPNQTMQNLSDMLEYGVDLGLRPCEFLDAKLDGRELTVQCAKYSEENERGLAPQREVILLDKFDEVDLDQLTGLFARLAAELAAVNGDRDRLVRRYAAALRRVRAKVPAAARVTQYTARHQFRANMARAGYSAAEIAVAMGHRSAQTNTSHYGRGNKGWPPVFGAKPIDVPAKLVARVRPGARAKAKAAAEDRAISSADLEIKTASNKSSVRRDIMTDSIQSEPDSAWGLDHTLSYGSEIEREVNAGDMQTLRY